MSTKTRFEEEAKGNSEMAYYMSSHSLACPTTAYQLRESGSTSRHVQYLVINYSMDLRP